MVSKTVGNLLFRELDQLYICYDRKSDKPNQIYVAIIDSSNPDYPSEYPQMSVKIDLSSWGLFKFGFKTILSSLGLAQF